MPKGGRGNERVGRRGDGGRAPPGGDDGGYGDFTQAANQDIPPSASATCRLALVRGRGARSPHRGRADGRVGPQPEARAVRGAAPSEPTAPERQHARLEAEPVDDHRAHLRRDADRRRQSGGEHVFVIKVKTSNGGDVSVKLAEIGVGQEPRCVAVSPDNREAFVTNGISGTVSVVDLKVLTVVGTIQVGPEPRGCALTADGSLLYVANHTAGTVGIINTQTRASSGTSRWGAIPPPSRSRARAPATSPTTSSSSPRSLPSSTPISTTPSSTAMGRRATSASAGSSTPSRQAMPIRRSPRSPSRRSPTPAFRRAA